MSDEQLWEALGKIIDDPDDHRNGEAIELRGRIREAAELAGWNPYKHGTFVEAQILGGVKLDEIERVDFPGRAGRGCESRARRARD